MKRQAKEHRVVVDNLDEDGNGTLVANRANEFVRLPFTRRCSSTAGTDCEFLVGTTFIDDHPIEAVVTRFRRPDTKLKANAIAF